MSLESKVVSHWCLSALALLGPLLFGPLSLLLLFLLLLKLVLMLIFQPLSGLPLLSSLLRCRLILSLILHGFHILLLFSLKLGNFSLTQLLHFMFAFLSIGVICFTVVLFALRCFDVLLFFDEFTEFFIVDRLLEQVLLQIVYVLVQAVLQAI